MSPPNWYGGIDSRIARDDHSTWNVLPHKFEAGTPNVADAIGLAAACEYLDAIGMDDVLAHERALVRLATDRLAQIGGVKVYGLPPAERSGVVSFTVADIHPHDLATIFDQEGVCIRANASTSFYVYNDESDVDALVRAIEHAKTLFAAPLVV